MVKKTRFCLKFCTTGPALEMLLADASFYLFIYCENCLSSASVFKTNLAASVTSSYIEIKMSIYSRRKAVAILSIEHGV